MPEYLLAIAQTLATVRLRFAFARLPLDSRGGMALNGSEESLASPPRLRDSRAKGLRGPLEALSLLEGPDQDVT